MHPVTYTVMVTITTGIQLQQDMVSMVLVMLPATLLQVISVQQDGIYQLAILLANLALLMLLWVVQEQANLPLKLPIDGVLILTTLSIPAACMALQLASAVRTGTIGRPRRTIVATPTACSSIAVPSTQARTTTTSTAGGWCVASLVCSSFLFVSFRVPGKCKGFTLVKHLAQEPKITKDFWRPPLELIKELQGKQICAHRAQVQVFHKRT